MSIQIVVPELGESVLEATVSQWLKQEGERVAVGEALVELETDKVNVEVGAERAGVLARIERAAGEDVRVGEVLGMIDETAEAGEAPPSGASPEATAPPPTEKNGEAGGKGGQRPTEHRESERRSEDRVPSADEGEKSIAGEKSIDRGARQKDGQQAGVPPSEGQVVTEPTARATPVAQRVAQELNVDLSQVQGTGPGGRVTRENVEQYAERPPAEAAPTPPAPQPREQVGAGLAPARPTSAAIEAAGEVQTSLRQTSLHSIAAVSADRREERVKMSRRRRTIAQRLVEAQQTAAMLTTFNEIDMGAVMDLRKRRNEAFQARYGVKLGITSFFVKAAIGALKAFPRLNAEIQGDEIVLKHYYDIGIAVGASEGLVVPVLRDADRMSFAQIEQKIKDFARQTEDGSLTIEDLRGGTFSITNGGVYGSLLSTPILNPPQVGILGLHKIEPRPVIVNGEGDKEHRVVARSMMYVALTYDHRIVDGREAVQFLVRVKELIEDPESLLIEG